MDQLPKYKEKIDLTVYTPGDIVNMDFEDKDLVFNNYVYVYSNPLVKLKDPLKILIGQEMFEFDYLPFYVGKGSGTRMLYHLKLDDCDLNLEKKETIKKIFESGNEPIITLVKNELTNVEAFTLENILITKLENLTNISGGKSKNLEYKVGSYKTTLEYDKKNKISTLLSEGKRVKEISKILNISERTIYRLKKDMVIE
jgi:hypothetical protein